MKQPKKLLNSLNPYTPCTDNIPIQNSHLVLNRLVVSILDMGLACSVINGRFGLVYLLQVRERVYEEHCFLK